MWLFLLKLFYLMLPAYFANMAPVFFRKNFKFLDKPVDMGKTWRDNEILGRKKTVRGFVVGISSAIIIIMVQGYLYKYPAFENVSILNYSAVNLILLGFLFGFGALLGDAIESFIKRRRGIKSSKPWKFWDQIDYLAGSLILTWLIIRISFLEVFAIIAMSMALTVIANHIGYYTKIRLEKW